MRHRPGGSPPREQTASHEHVDGATLRRIERNPAVPRRVGLDEIQHRGDDALAARSAGDRTSLTVDEHSRLLKTSTSLTSLDVDADATDEV